VILADIVEAPVFTLADLATYFIFSFFITRTAVSIIEERYLSCCDLSCGMGKQLSSK
jgi:hypothetical protein